MIDWTSSTKTLAGATRRERHATLLARAFRSSEKIIREVPLRFARRSCTSSPRALPRLLVSPSPFGMGGAKKAVKTSRKPRAGKRSTGGGRASRAGDAFVASGASLRRYAPSPLAHVSLGDEACRASFVEYVASRGRGGEPPPPPLATSFAAVRDAVRATAPAGRARDVALGMLDRILDAFAGGDDETPRDDATTAPPADPKHASRTIRGATSARSNASARPAELGGRRVGALFAPDLTATVARSDRRTDADENASFSSDSSYDSSSDDDESDEDEHLDALPAMNPDVDRLWIGDFAARRGTLQPTDASSSDATPSSSATVFARARRTPRASAPPPTSFVI